MQTFWRRMLDFRPLLKKKSEIHDGSRYQSTRYREFFAFVDHIRLIKDPMIDTTRERWQDWRESIPSCWGQYGIASFRLLLVINSTFCACATITSCPKFHAA